MSKVRTPVSRLVRTYGPLPSLTCNSKKIKKEKTPGQHGKTLKQVLKAKSPYGLRLYEKQSLRFYYNLSERQLQRYVAQAKKSAGSTGETLVGLLEMRLDNLVWRANMACSIRQARQFISHGHIFVNNVKVNVASYGCTKKDVVHVRKDAPIEPFVRSRWARRKKKSQNKPDHASGPPKPDHLKISQKRLSFLVLRWVKRHNIGHKWNLRLIVEYYSR